MKRLYFSIFALFFVVLACFGQEARIGEVLPAWQKGELDIHFINTGHGECTYLIFPDGTTFLVDASGQMNKKDRNITSPWKPNADAAPGKTIANYIMHFSPEVSKGHINYVMLTHHHGDHMGQLTKNTPWHSSTRFQLTSLPEVGSLIAFDKIFDRDPSFSFPKAETSATMTNYQDFLNWTKRKNKTKIEKWAVGSSTQVVPLHDKSYNFTILNIAGNGCAATGKEGEYLSYMPPKPVFDVMDKDAYPNENCLSCAYLLSYGKFDFYAGGDLQYQGRDKYSYKDAETPMFPVIHKVEVAKANHHGISNANSADLLNVIAPDVWLVGTWVDKGMPGSATIKRVLKASPDCDIFCTYQSNWNLGSIVSAIGFDEADRHMVGRYGHVVVRVALGGDSYMVYTLEDSDEEYKVKSIHGPYICSDPE